MHILLVEPYFSGSHQQWAEAWMRHSRHTFSLISLPGRHWKWRMMGGAVSLARQAQVLERTPDLIVATDMLDLNTFLSLIRRFWGPIPVALYFHENQITYPWSPNDPDPSLQRDHYYGFINYTSALAADRIFFNSAFHRDSFLEGLEELLHKLPDYKEIQNVALLTKKSEVLPLGLELKSMQVAPKEVSEGSPILLWNHRWEYDKDPEAFFNLLFRLKEEDVPFRLVVLGAHFRSSPPVFAEARERLRDHILHFGYVEDRRQYAQWMQRADILPVTSRQDFFGISIIEAIYCGCYPLLPRRLAYPEHIPVSLQEPIFYKDEKDLFLKTKQLLEDFQPKNLVFDIQDFVARYDWSNLAGVYDKRMEGVVS